MTKFDKNGKIYDKMDKIGQKLVKKLAIYDKNGQDQDKNWTKLDKNGQKFYAHLDKKLITINSNLTKANACLRY